MHAPLSWLVKTMATLHEADVCLERFGFGFKKANNTVASMHTAV
jgi:hypothetical protein